MDEKNWKNIKEIFLLVLEKDTESRTGFLDEICADDSALREEIESLLASHDEIEDFIEEPAFKVGEVFSNGSDHTEKHFGNYKIIREIGYGGMGAVFLAERDDGEFTQQVAIKIIRQAIAESELVNRFKRERQILASLNHPNIAKLFDGGVSNDGLPFLAMEFIEGEAITTFAARENLKLQERLKLFLKVCSAVAYAHRNLVVHRDLKPSNILVTDEGEPKLLDFGLAKMLSDNLSNEADQTQTAFRALTPAYASPEQLKNETITTASDIYSLGIVLYELLTSERPFQFEGKSLDEIIKTVTSIDPPVPSINPKSKIRNPKLKGDLDNIALTALRKEPERRYKSVEAFANDIERYLNGLPVSARPNTFKYRASKYVKRHRIGVLAASLILLSLIGGIVVSVWQAQVARSEKAKAETVNKFLQEILNYSDNSTGLAFREGRETTVKDVLNEASKRLETEDLSSQPEVKAELHRIIGASYLTQGNYEQAEKNLRAALALQTQLYGNDSLETLPTLIELGQVFLVSADYQNAEKIYLERLSILRREHQKGAINPVYLLVALNDFAVLRRSQGNSKEAEMFLREGLALKPQIAPNSRIAVGISESVLALTLSDQGNFEEAEKIVRSRIAEIRQQTNSETLELASNLNGLGNFLMEKGVWEDAMQNLLEAEKIYRKLTNPYYLPLGDNLRLQAQTLYLQGNFAEAEKKINETLEIYRKSSRPQNINYPTALMIQGLIFNKTNRSAEAEKILREALEIRTKNLPPEHFLTALAKSALGECLMTLKKYSEAETLLTESVVSLKQSQGTENPRTLLVKSRIAALYEKTNREELAAQYR